MNIGPGEILVILVIALVVLGPTRLPATARTLGRFIAKTRDVVARFQQEMQAAADVPLEIIARERGRLTEPIRTSNQTGTPQPDDPTLGDSEPAGSATESAETAEPACGSEETPATSESDSEPEDRDAR
ncbi:MAG: twin-arginine translocase subunit TatB [Acidimicrobiia bacterium]|nr:twin-arginine translocase subunit TatB [Acidimicrobiia bacterium]